MSVLRVPSANADLSVEVHGEGESVLFVHGFPFDRRMWQPHLTSLRRWRRIAPDLRGAGDSRVLGGDYAFARYADDLIAVLDAVEVQEAIVCGLSMGGYIAFDMLRRYRSRIRALILAGTRPEADSSEAKRARDDMIALAEREGPGAVAERMLPRVLARATIAEHPERVRQVRAMMDGWSRAAIIGALRAMRDRPDSTGLLSTIAVPTLVIVGEDDVVTPPPDARRMADAIKGAKLVTIPNAGHLAPFEQPDAVGNALTEFLETLG
jgi:pimeloyl-ACP methyl ester carboxylesterase